VMINDQWPNPPADGVGGPMMKLKYRNPAVAECAGNIDSTNNCYDTLSYIDSSGTNNANSGSVSDYYMSTYYDFATDVTVLTKLYLIVRNGEARYGWWNSADQKWMMTWASLPDSYSGGSIGFFTYAHQPYYQDLYITDLDVYNTDIVNGMCGGHGTCTDGACTCDVGYNFTYASTGLCGIETQDQTSAPSVTPVPTPEAYVGAGDICVGNDASSTLLDFDATMSGWTEVDDVQDDGSAISSPCAWTAYAADSVDYLQVLGLEIDGADGSSSYAIHQTSNAWGNYPGDNTLTGCNLLYDGATYTNFILEAKMYHNDNDGVGFVFGWTDLLDHYQAAMINDQWPSPPADGISGPHMKIKRRRKACEPVCSTPYVDGNTAGEDCYETLAYLNNGGPSEDMQGDMEGAVSNFHADQYIAYPNYGVPSETAASLYLIVKNNQVRMTRWEATEQKWVSTWALLPAAYAGGKIGLFTYAHQPTIWDVKITDLDAMPYPSMCNGMGSCYLGTCDCGSSPLGDDGYSATGLCDSTPEPTKAPQPAPTAKPTTVPAPVPTSVGCTDGVFTADIETDVDCGNTCPPCTRGLNCAVNSDCQTGACDGGVCVYAPTPQPTTPAPTRAPIVSTTVELSGITCTDFDSTTYQTALDATIDSDADADGDNDAEFGTSTCATATTTTVAVTTEITVPLSVVALYGADSVHAHVMSELTADTDFDGVYDLENNIISAASSRRRRLDMSSVSVASISVDTFSPTPAPTPTPSVDVDDPATSKKGTSSAGASTTMIIVLVVVLVALSGTAVVVFVMLKQRPGSKPAMEVPAENAGAAMAVPVSAGGATPAGATKEGVAVSTATAGMEMTVQSAPKSSVAI